MLQHGGFLSELTVDETTSMWAGTLSAPRPVGAALGWVSGRVVGDAGELPAYVQSVLEWVAREGTTNIVPHSVASTCVITVCRPSRMPRR